MNFMYADEADHDGKREYLIYGAVFIPADKAVSLNSKILLIRRKCGFSDRDVLKFSTGTKPKHVERDKHTEAKSKILDAAIKHDCLTCCYVVPHSIAKGQSHENKLKFGVNTLLLKFDEYLKSIGEDGGIAFFDGTKEYRQDKHLREVFTEGLQFPGRRKKLSKVVAIHQTSEGHSNFGALADIVVGSFRFVFNEPDKDQVGTLLFKQLATMMWGKDNGTGTKMVRERGLCIRPKDVDRSAYSADVQATLDRLRKYLTN